MGQVLLVLDAIGGQFGNGTQSCIAAASAAASLLGAAADILIVGKGRGESLAAQVSHYGARRVLVIESDEFDINVPETIVSSLVPIARDYRVIVASADAMGLELLPRLAALLDAGYVAECFGIRPHEGGLAFCHALYAGNINAWVYLDSPIASVTVRSSHFPPASEVTAASPVERIAVEQRAESLAAAVEVVEVTASDPALARLAQAPIIVAGGVRLKSAFFQVLRPLASILGAEIGATRAACVAGFAPFERQVGQTGKIVAPQLYLAVGISGSVQHMAGMKGARTIVAINKSADAPIFRWADYGLVADMFEAVPALVQALEARSRKDVPAATDS